MGAVHGAMAGAAAGAARYQHWLNKIDSSFNSPKEREEAKTILDLIQNEEGSAALSIILMILGIPSMYGGSVLGGMISESGEIIGCFAGLIILAGLIGYINRLFRKDAKNETSRFVKSCEQGELIEKKVREILSS